MLDIKEYLKQTKTVLLTQEAFDELMQRASAQPERTGRWIYGEHDVAMCDGYSCDKCGFFVPWDYQHKAIDFIKDYHYCPSCKAKMLTYTGAEVEHE